MPHGGVLQLHQVLEQRVAEHTARVLRLPGWERRARLVEVHRHQGRLAGVAALWRHLVVTTG